MLKSTVNKGVVFMFCPKCGNNVPPNTKFCRICGHEFKQTQERADTVTNVAGVSLPQSSIGGTVNSYPTQERATSKIAFLSSLFKKREPKKEKAANVGKKGLFRREMTEYRTMSGGKKAACSVMAAALGIFIFLSLLFAFTYSASANNSISNDVLFLKLTVKDLFATISMFLVFIALSLLMICNTVWKCIKNLRLLLLFFGVSAATGGALCVAFGMLSSKVAPLFGEKISDVFLPLEGSCARVMLPAGMILLTLAIAMILSYVCIRLLRQKVVLREAKKHFPYNIVINICVLILCAALSIAMIFA